MKILIIDTCYPDFLKRLPFDPNSTYEVELRKVLDYQFGTADFYSKNLRVLGWEAMDVISNHRSLQEMWLNDSDYAGWNCFQAQIIDFDPDVIFLQDLNIQLPHDPAALVAGQCSCPWPGDDKIRQCDVIFTSFPHYVPRIEALGVEAAYNPLAFEPIVLEGIDHKERIHDCTFVGGIGAPSHWRYGMQVLNAVAEMIPTFKWWGYGAEHASGALRDKYQGEAWGVDMYKILLQSKIVLNRHGEVAEGYANNMRLFEATGCGAMLVTEAAPNLHDFFDTHECVRYFNPADAVSKINYYLKHDEARADIAAAGQRRTLRDHIYAKRMETVSNTLKEMLVAA